MLRAICGGVYCKQLVGFGYIDVLLKHIVGGVPSGKNKLNKNKKNKN